ncbi:sigma 54-interacting transcriptional regulator [bacterium]|nr:sigma 54-interacting transcriptional regulator [bacterium]
MTFQIIDNRYEVHELLGQGNWGEVYRVIDLSNDQPKALKIIKNLDRAAVPAALLKEEFRRLIRLQHPHIVTVHDFNVWDGRLPFFTMEYMPGGPLKLNKAAYQEPLIKEILIRICLALQYIHTQGYIHGDLKPENLLLGDCSLDQWSVDQVLPLKVSDFSFAEIDQVGQDNSTRPLTGTLLYLAPEKFFNLPPDNRSDLYSLGVLLYQLATGSYPHQAKTVSEYIHTLLHQHPTPPTRLNSHISEKMEFIILTLLEKEPLKRFQSAREILHLLGRSPEGSAKKALVELSRSSVINDIFIGRDQELTTINDLLVKTEQGTGHILFLYGEAGLGRSRLVREMKISAQLHAFKTVLTTCGPGSASSFKPLKDILLQLGFSKYLGQGSLEPEMVKHLLAFMDRETSGKPDLSNDKEEAGLETSIRLNTLFEELFRFIELLCSRVDSEQTDSEFVRDNQPVLLVIEDLHHGQAALLQFCEFLARNLEHVPVFLCVTFCDDDLIRAKGEELHPLLALMDQQGRAENCTALRLARMSLEETSQMVTNILEVSTEPRALVTKIHELSGGNPLHVQELLHFMLENRILSFERGNWRISDKDAFREVPSQLRLVLEARYERLSELSKAVLQKASFLPEHFYFSDLEQLTGQAPTILAELLDDFCAAKIMERIKQTNELMFRFAHPLFRQLIFFKTLVDDKVDIHRQTAFILEKHVNQGKPGLAGLLSFHFQAASEREKAYVYAMQAADYAKAQYSFEEEVVYLEQARSLRGPDNNDSKGEILLEQLAEAYLRTNRLNKASALLRELFNNSLFLKDHARIGRFARNLAKTFEIRGDYRVACEVLSQALEGSDPTEISPQTIELKSTLGWMHSLLKEYKKAQAICSDALNDAKAIKSEDLMAKTYLTLGKIAEAYGNYQSAEKQFSKALQLNQSLKDERGIAASLNNLGTLADKIGNAQKAIAYHEKGLALVRKHYDINGEANALVNLGSAHALQGNWSVSLSYFQHALDIFKRLGNLQAQSVMHHNLGELFLRMGEFRESHQHFTTALKLRERLHDDIGMAITHLSLASLGIEQHEYGSALDYLARSMPVFRRTNLKRCQAIAHRLTAEVQLRQDNVSYALREINRARKIIDKVEDNIELGNILRMSGEISLKLGDSNKGQEALNESVALLEKIGARYELGQTYLFLAHEQLKSENIRQAGHTIEKAEAIFEELKTPQLLKKAEQLKQELNSRLQPLYFHLPSDQEQLKSLISITHIINSTKELDHLLEQILDTIIKTLKADRGAIFLKDHLTGRLQAEIIRNLESETLFDAAQLSTTVLNNVVLRGEPVYITDTSLDSLCAHSKSVSLYGIVAIICVPLKVYDDLIGVVYLDTRSMTDIFLEKDVQFVASFANIAALALANGLERKQLIKENVSYRIQNKEFYRSNNIIAHSRTMQTILKTVAKIASSSSTVLLTGASGTGKELIAKAIHNMGNRSDKVFIPFFCGNAPETLIDSELFGHVKGAFSGAIDQKRGIFEEAHQGTVFLDEISEIGPQIQAKLLRFLQEKEVKPLGSNVIKHVDVRIIAATNKDLDTEIKAGRFRQDLMYRLKVIQINLPPLKDHKEDIAPLAYHFLQKYNHILHKKVKGFTKAVLERLDEYSWPGNIRELENQVELAVNLADEDSYIDEGILNDEVRHIETMIKGVHVTGTLKDVLSQVERELLVSALVEHKGNKSRAARRLGITRQCLNQKLKHYDIY